MLRTFKQSPTSKNDAESCRTRLFVEALEGRDVPAVAFTETYAWEGAGTVTVTVDDAVPGYEGLYHWNYHLENDEFAEGIAAFAVPVEDSAMVSNLGSSAG